MQALYERSTKLHRGAGQTQIETLIESILSLGQMAMVVNQLSQQRHRVSHIWFELFSVFTNHHIKEAKYAKRH